MCSESATCSPFKVIQGAFPFGPNESFHQSIEYVYNNIFLNHFSLILINDHDHLAEDFLVDGIS